MSGIVGFAVRAAITLALLALLFAQADMAALARTLGGVDLWLFVAAFAVQCIVIPLSAWRWQLLLRSLGCSVPILQLTQITWIATFFGTFLPASAGQDLVRGRLLYLRGIGLAALLNSILLDRFFGITLLALLAVPPLLLTLEDKAARDTIVLAAAMLVAFLIVAVAAVRPTLKLTRALPLPRALRRVLGIVEDVVAGCWPVLRDARVVLAAAAISLAFHLLTVLFVFLLGRSIGIGAGLATYLLFVPLIFLMATLPVSIGGLGVREAGFVLLFAQVSVSDDKALTLSLLVFTIMLISSGAGGLLYLAMGSQSAKPAPSPHASEAKMLSRT